MYVCMYNAKYYKESFQKTLKALIFRERAPTHTHNNIIIFLNLRCICYICTHII